MRLRSFIVLTSSASFVAAIGALVACSSSEARDRFPDAGGGRDAAIPPEVDSGGDAESAKPPFDPSDAAVTCAGTPCAIDLVAGDRHFCARMNDGTVRCWGDDTRGALGVDAGTPGESSIVGSVTGLAGVTQLSAGGATTCAVLEDGGVRCWGANDKGQLGLDVSAPMFDDEPHPTPAPVALPSTAKRVDVGPASACALLASGEVWCWGDNGHEQLARETATAIGAPGRADLGELQVTRTAAGMHTAFAVTDSGDLVSWGALLGYFEGVLGGREASVSPSALPLSTGLGPVTSLSASSTTAHAPDTEVLRRGIAHACVVVDGELHCWGDSLRGALGTGVPKLERLPRRVQLTSDTAWAQQVAAGGDITCVRLTDGTIECAGDNGFGALGMDPKTLSSIFFRPAETFDGYAVRIAVASHSVCALIHDGSVVCWGSNERGELGQGTTDTAPHPTPVSVRF